MTSVDQFHSPKLYYTAITYSEYNFGVLANISSGKWVILLNAAFLHKREKKKGKCFPTQARQLRAISVSKHKDEAFVLHFPIRNTIQWSASSSSRDKTLTYLGLGKHRID